MFGIVAWFGLRFTFAFPDKKLEIVSRIDALYFDIRLLFIRIPTFKNESYVAYIWNAHRSIVIIVLNIINWKFFILHKYFSFFKIILYI